MAKIKTYPFVDVPTLDDKVIGTDVDNSNRTKNFRIGDIGALFADLPDEWPGTFQQVTDLGATTTNGITILGGGSLFAGSLTISGNLDLSSGTVNDSAGEPGVSGQLLQSNGPGGGVSWVDTSLLNPTLQTVTEGGNTTDQYVYLNSGGYASNFSTLELLLGGPMTLGSDQGQAGYVMTSQGPGALPTWESLGTLGGNSLGVADQTIPTATQRFVNFSELSNLIFFGGPTNDFVIDGLGVFFVETQEITLNTRNEGGADTVDIITNKLKLNTSAVSQSQALPGMLLRLIDATTGECEWWSQGKTISNDPIPQNGIVSYVNDGNDTQVSTIQDDGTTTGINSTPKPSTQIHVDTILGTSIEGDNAGTTNPGYGVVGNHSGNGATPKTGVKGSAYSGTVGSAQLGVVGVGGQEEISAPRRAFLLDTQIGVIGTAGGGVDGQAKYGGYFVAEEDTADDNIGVYIEVANGGAGNFYGMQIIDGNEGLGKVWTSDALGRGAWATIPTPTADGIDDVLAIGQPLTASRLIGLNGNALEIKGDGALLIEATDGLGSVQNVAIKGDSAYIALESTATGGGGEKSIVKVGSGDVEINVWLGKLFTINDSANSTGLSGEVLTADGLGDSKWQTIPALTVGEVVDAQVFGVGQSNISQPNTPFTIVRKTAITSGGDTIVIPEIADLTAGMHITIKDVSLSASTSDPLTIQEVNNVTIDGLTEVVMTKAGESLTIYFNGTNFDII